MIAHPAFSSSFSQRRTWPRRSKSKAEMSCSPCHFRVTCNVSGETSWCRLTTYPVSVVFFMVPFLVTAPVPDSLFPIAGLRPITKRFYLPSFMGSAKALVSWNIFATQLDQLTVSLFLTRVAASVVHRGGSPFRKLSHQVEKTFIEDFGRPLAKENPNPGG